VRIGSGRGEGGFLAIGAEDPTYPIPKRRDNHE